MPIEYDLPMPEKMRCMKVKLPILLAEAEAQVVVDNTAQTPELVKKIDHIDVMVMGLEAEPVFVHENESNWSMSFSKKWPYHCCCKPGRAFVKKIILRGILHKQIYYVNQNDDVRHFGEDVPFSKMISLHEPEPVMDIDDVLVQFPKAKVDITWDLIRGCRLQQTGVIGVRVKILEERNMFIQVCPPQKGCSKENLLRDPGLEQWIGDIPVAWGGINIERYSDSPHGGSYSARLGANTMEQSAIFQIVRKIRHHHMRFDHDHHGDHYKHDYNYDDCDNHHHHGQHHHGDHGYGHYERPHAYRLCFWAKKDSIDGGSNCRFTLTANVIYYDEDGDILANLQNQWSSSSVGTAWNQYCFDAGPPPEDVAYAKVFIALRPEVDNNDCFVLVDDASLVCVL